MPEAEELLQRITELTENAEGYMTDAEFREEYETRQIRYLQAISSLLLAIAFQNRLLIEALRKGEEG